MRPASPPGRRRFVRRLLMVIAVMLAALPLTVQHARADTSGWFPAYPGFYEGDNGAPFTVSAGGCTLTADFKVLSGYGHLVQIDTNGDGFPACWPADGTTSHLQLELEFFDWDAPTGTSPFSIYTENVTPGYDSEFVRALGDDVINMHGLTLVKMWLSASSEDYSSRNQVTVPFDTRMCNRPTSRPDLPATDCGQQPNITISTDMSDALPAPQPAAWQSAITLPGASQAGRILSLSCTSAGNCTGGGSYNDSAGVGRALVADEVNGTWQTAIEVPGTAALGPLASVGSVSCASPGNCTAGGSYNDSNGVSQGFVAGEVNGTWQTAIEVPGLAALSRGTKPGWGSSVNSVSCGSAGNCSAGGHYVDSKNNGQAFIANEVNGTWQTAIEMPGTDVLNIGIDAAVTSVSCTSAGNCSAGGYYSGAGVGPPFVADEVNGTWQAAIEVPGIAALNTAPTGTYGYTRIWSVSCAVAGYCSAGGYYTDSSGARQAFVVSQVGGTWQTAIQVPGLAALNTHTATGADARVSSVSCPSAGNCSAGGYYMDSLGRYQPFAVDEVSGTWQSAMPVPGIAALNSGTGRGPGPFVPSGIQSVSCAWAGNCSAGGTYLDSSGHRQAFVVDEANGTWQAAIEVPGTAALNTGGNARVGSVSCAPGGNCAFAGYLPGSSMAQPFVVSSSPPHYTIMGDSYSAGEGNGSYDAGSDTSTDQCHRSPWALGRQYAQYFGLVAVHTACSGAVIDNVLNNGQYTEPPQIAQVDPLSKLVTITIGGNDAGFAKVLTRCLNPLLTCQAYYTQNNSDNLDNIINNLYDPLVSVYTAIKNRAPQAQVVAVTYPNIFTPDQTCLGVANLGKSDVNWFISETYHLDDVIKAAANAAGINYEDVRNDFAGHGVCDPVPWAYPLPIPWPSNSSLTDTSSWFHPSITGQQVLATQLRTDYPPPPAGW